MKKLADGYPHSLRTTPSGFIAEPKSEASNRDALSSPFV